MAAAHRLTRTKISYLPTATYRATAATRPPLCTMRAFAEALAISYVAWIMNVVASKPKRTQRFKRRTPQPRGMRARDQHKFIKPLRVLQSYRCLPSDYLSKLAGYAH